MLRRSSWLSAGVAAALFLSAANAFADKVAVLPFRAPKGGVSKPELDEARKWSREATTQKGHTLPTDAEMLSAEMAVKDGTADTSQEHRAAGKASSSQWTVAGVVERHDTPPAILPDGTKEEPYTTYRIEIEACQVDTGRVESLAREVDPEDAPAQIAEMLAVLLRPEGIANADLPWIGQPPPKRKPKPAPPPPPPPPPEPPPPPTPVVKHAYAENRPFAIGGSIGFTDAVSRPAAGRGPSSGMPIGVAFAYAPFLPQQGEDANALSGIELRGILTSQVLGPKALAIAVGGRYALPILPQYRLYAGPEVMLGTHVAVGAEKTARFLVQGAAFVSLGLGEMVQVEAAPEVALAAGGSGTLVLLGGTGRVLLRF